MVSCLVRPFSFIFQVAVEKYDEVLHHLGFAQELHKTLDCLTQNVSFCDCGVTTGTVSNKEFLILHCAKD